MFLMTRYSIESKCLIPWVKFIWCFEMDKANIHQKLLPTDCIDVILNLSNDMIYETGFSEITAPPFHVNGLRSTHSYIHQVGNVRIFGISFFPYGFYPFINKPLNDIHAEIVDLGSLSASLAHKLRAAVSCLTSQKIVEHIENSLCSELRMDGDYMRKANIIADYLKTGDDVTVKIYCDEQGLNIKTFERICLRYTGYMPKALRRIRRFQTASNQLIYNNSESLTEIAYDNSFTDQSHFIKEFRRFAGAAPRAFRKERVTVKENTRYTYV